MLEVAVKFESWKIAQKRPGGHWFLLDEDEGTHYAEISLFGFNLCMTVWGGIE